MTTTTRQTWDLLLRGGSIILQPSINPNYRYVVRNERGQSVVRLTEAQFGRVMYPTAPARDLIRVQYKSGTKQWVARLKDVRALHGSTWIKRRYKKLKELKKAEAIA